jgi:hypothetical protein
LSWPIESDNRGGGRKYGVGREGRKGERGVFSQIFSCASRPLGRELTLETFGLGI